MNDHKALDLDELFGDARPIKVRWKGTEYNLLRLDAFSPREINAFQKMHKESLELSQVEGNEDRVVALFDKMLEALCPSLPLAEMPFLAKTRIITFYIEETEGKKALEVALVEQIGATPSAGSVSGTDSRSRM